MKEKIITHKNLEMAKQLARKIKKNNNIPHHEALELVASIIGIGSWEDIVSINKYSYKRLKNKSITIVYDVSESAEDWHLIPTSIPIENILNVQSEEWEKEGLSVHEMITHIVNTYDAFRLTPLLEKISLAELNILLEEISFFFPAFLFKNGNIIELEELIIDVEYMFCEYKRLFY